jgi:hypothetical protein
VCFLNSAVVTIILYVCNVIFAITFYFVSVLVFVMLMKKECNICCCAV